MTVPGVVVWSECTMLGCTALSSLEGELDS